jgi:hypothetical protein
MPLCCIKKGIESDRLGCSGRAQLLTSRFNLTNTISLFALVQILTLSMEEVFRIKSSQHVSLAAQSSSLNEAEMGRELAAQESKRFDTRECYEKELMPEGAKFQTSWRGCKQDAGQGVWRCSSGHKRKVLSARGVRMCRSVRTIRVCAAAAAVKEAVQALAVEKLGVLDRAAGRLMEWLQVIAFPSILFVPECKFCS